MTHASLDAQLDAALDAPLDAPLAPSSTGDVPRDWRNRPRFAESHRALAACGREVTRLFDETVKQLKTRHAAGEFEAPVVSQSPGRCMVQLGPVALTLTWLRSSLDVVADGQMLVMLWEGSVVRGTRRIPERAHVAKAASATTLWEDTLVVLADDEASWKWHSSAADVADTTTSGLVERCLERLVRAHAERRTDG